MTLIPKRVFYQLYHGTLNSVEQITLDAGFKIELSPLNVDLQHNYNEAKELNVTKMR